eukprot:scaffold58946_cov63-Phaeocystis_antarctica.AAC.12
MKRTINHNETCTTSTTLLQAIGSQEFIVADLRSGAVSCVSGSGRRSRAIPPCAKNQHETESDSRDVSPRLQGLLSVSLRLFRFGRRLVQQELARLRRQQPKDLGLWRVGTEGEPLAVVRSQASDHVCFTYRLDLQLCTQHVVRIGECVAWADDEHAPQLQACLALVHYRHVSRRVDELIKLEVGVPLRTVAPRCFDVRSALRGAHGGRSEVGGVRWEENEVGGEIAWAKRRGSAEQCGTSRRAGRLCQKDGPRGCLLCLEESLCARLGYLEARLAGTLDRVPQLLLLLKLCLLLHIIATGAYSFHLAQPLVVIQEQAALLAAETWRAFVLFCFAPHGVERGRLALRIIQEERWARSRAAKRQPQPVGVTVVLKEQAFERVELAHNTLPPAVVP